MAADGVPGTESPPDLSLWSVPELQAKLAEIGAPVMGEKPELLGVKARGFVQRLAGGLTSSSTAHLSVSTSTSSVFHCHNGSSVVLFHNLCVVLAFKTLRLPTLRAVRPLKALVHSLPRPEAGVDERGWPPCWCCQKAR